MHQTVKRLSEHRILDTVYTECQICVGCQDNRTRIVACILPFFRYFNGLCSNEIESLVTENHIFYVLLVIVIKQICLKTIEHWNLQCLTQRKYSSSLYCTIHIHIIGHYNLSVRIIDQASYTTHVVCINFIHKWRDLKFKVDSARQIF